jgi:uncharacterized membrane protein
MWLLLTGIAITLEYFLAASTLSQHVVTVLFIHQLITLVCAAGLTLLLIARQSQDVSTIRSRHLFSFPVKPIQVVSTKLIACLIAAVGLFLTLNILFFCLFELEGYWSSLAHVLMATADQVLGTILIWGLFMMIKRIPSSATLVLLIWILSMVLKSSTNPSSLLLVFESAGQPLFVPRLLSLGVLLITLFVVEHNLRFRPVL